MALDTGFRTPKPLRGIIAMSGGLYEEELPDLEARKDQRVLIVQRNTRRRDPSGRCAAGAPCDRGPRNPARVPRVSDGASRHAGVDGGGHRLHSELFRIVIVRWARALALPRRRASGRQDF